MTTTTLKAPVAGTIEPIVKKWGKETFYQTFTMPNGKEEKFFLFRGLTVPSIIFPVTKKGEVIFVRQFRFGAGEFVDEIPGGNPKGSETPEQVLRDELLEETGYEASEVAQLGPPIWFDPASVRTPYVPMIALGCERVSDPNPDATEIMEVLTVPMRTWLEMVRGGKVRDSKTLAVTLLAVMRLGLIDPQRIGR